MANKKTKTSESKEAQETEIEKESILKAFANTKCLVVWLYGWLDRWMVGWLGERIEEDYCIC